MDIKKFNKIVFFTGAGMSAESGVPTYRGRGGIWEKYNYEEYACQEAFNKDPEKVLKFHELRRKAGLKCNPHKGHEIISKIEKKHPNVMVVTQNIDGMHQRAGNKNVIELHGSLWRLVCPEHGVFEDIGEYYKNYKCEKCGKWLRPDIIWFGDSLKGDIMQQAIDEIKQADLFISIGTSGVVWPAAGFPQIAKENGAYCIEINIDDSEMSSMYNKRIRKPASEGLELFG